MMIIIIIIIIIMIMIMIMIIIIIVVKGTPVTNMAQSFSFRENASSFGIISSCFHRNQKENDT